MYIYISVYWVLGSFFKIYPDYGVSIYVDLDMQPQSIKKKELDGILVWELEYQPSWVWSTTGDGWWDFFSSFVKIRPYDIFHNEWEWGMAMVG